MKKDLKKHYAPRKWRLSTILGVVTSIKDTLLKTKKRSPEWYRLQYKRELYQIKKHIIFMEELLDQAKKDG